MKENAYSFGRTYVKQIREDCGNMQQAAFAQKLGISLSYLQNFEDDKKGISSEAMIKIFIKMSELSNISVYDLTLLETKYQLMKIEIAKAKGV